jgi:hypothetical protein
MDVIEKAGERLVDQAYELLKPTVGKWLGIHEGHHFQEFADGTTSDMRLASLLKTRHLGTSAFNHLVFTRGKTARAVDIWSSHGCGGGNSPAAPVNKLDSRILPAYDADIYLVAHMTRMASTVVNRIVPSWGGKEPRLHHKGLHLVGTGGFSRAIQVGKRQGLVPRGSYVEQAMMRPVALGAPTIRIRLERIRSNGSDTLTTLISTTL